MPNAFTRFFSCGCCGTGSGPAEPRRTGLTRRNFFKCCGAAAVAMTCVTPGVVRAANTIKFWMHNFDEKGFGEETLLKKAMDIVAARFQDKRVWQNVYNLTPSRYYLKGGVMDRSNLKDDDTNRRNLLWHQLHWLSQPNDADDTEPAFPNVQLYAYHEKSKVVGYALPDDHVVVKSVGNSVRQSGEFKVYLNRYNLAAGGVYSEPEEWASTIAHEMLHNLGHLHEKGDYTDEWQINVFNNAVLCNGYYRNPKYKWRSAHLECGKR